MAAPWRRPSRTEDVVALALTTRPPAVAIWGSVKFAKCCHRRLFDRSDILQLKPEFDGCLEKRPGLSTVEAEPGEEDATLLA